MSGGVRAGEAGGLVGRGCLGGRVLGQGGPAASAGLAGTCCRDRASAAAAGVARMSSSRWRRAAGAIRGMSERRMEPAWAVGRGAGRRRAEAGCARWVCEAREGAGIGVEAEKAGRGGPRGRSWQSRGSVCVAVAGRGVSASAGRAGTYRGEPAAAACAGGVSWRRRSPHRGVAGAAWGARGQWGRGMGMGGRTAGKALVSARDSRRVMCSMTRWKVFGVHAAASSAAGSCAGR